MLDLDLATVDCRVKITEVLEVEKRERDGEMTFGRGKFLAFKCSQRRN